MPSGTSNEQRPASHACRMAPANRASSISSARAPNTMSPASSGSRLGETAGQVVSCDRLVHRVGLHVLVEELRGGLTKAKPAQATCIAAVGTRRGHLEHGEVADDGTP